MMENKWSERLGRAGTLADVFEVVKDAAWKSMGRSRGGLMLGLADLGNTPHGFFGAFYPVGTNIIVMNSIPLLRIKETQEPLWRPYSFHVLLHEYLHTLGFLDEREVRQMVRQISKELFGEEHEVTKIARDTTKYFPNLAYPNLQWQPQELDIQLVEKFDRGSVNYIA